MLRSAIVDQSHGLGDGWCNIDLLQRPPVQQHYGL